jgi:hypothetical protein
METIMVQPSSDAEMRLLKEFLEKTKIKNKLISEEDKEGFVLGLMMQETDYEDTIDTTEFINHLRGK